MITTILVGAAILISLLIYLGLKNGSPTPVTDEDIYDGSIARRDQEIKLTIGTLGTHLGKTGKRRSYTAVKLKGKKGTNRHDWDYYDETGDFIYDLILIALLFDVFENEDWDSESVYNVDDYQYFEDISIVEAAVNAPDVEGVEEIVEAPIETVVEEVVVEAPVETPAEDTYVSPAYEPPVYEAPEPTRSYESPSYESPSSSSSSSSDYGSSSDSGSSDSGGGSDD